MATVGYGDIHPTSEVSRLFAIFYMIFGISVYIASIGAIGASYLRRLEHKIEMEQIKRINQIEKGYWSVAFKHFQKIETIQKDKKQKIKKIISPQKKTKT